MERLILQHPLDPIESAKQIQTAIKALGILEQIQVDHVIIIDATKHTYEKLGQILHPENPALKDIDEERRDIAFKVSVSSILNSEEWNHPTGENILKIEEAVNDILPNGYKMMLSNLENTLYPSSTWTTESIQENRHAQRRFTTFIILTRATRTAKLQADRTRLQAYINADKQYPTFPPTAPKKEAYLNQLYADLI